MEEDQLKISEFIVHKLNKEQHQRTASVELRSNTLAVNSTTRRLIESLHGLYSSRANKGYGRFEDNVDEFPTQKYLQRYINNEVGFVEFSTSLMDHLKERIAREQLAKGGYVLVVRIANGAKEFILTAIVTEVIGTAITEELDVVDTVHLDMSHLRVAGRIDISAWQSGADRYISFLKGRGDVAEYFKLFLGCNDVLIALEESRKLTNAIESFVQSQNIDQLKKDEILESAHDYLKNLSKQGRALSLDAFSNHLWPEDPDILKKEFANEEIKLSDGFVPDLRAIRGLVKFEGKAQYWKLTFDRKAIRNGELKYNSETGSITLNNVPEELKAELANETEDD